MATIRVNLNAFYGYGHGGGCYGSNEAIELEINEQELKALQRLGEEEISCDAVFEAIENGESVLESLHEKLEDKFYYMVEEYWLYEAYNECLHECLAEHIEQDINDGLYTPASSDDEEDSFDCNCLDDDSEEDVEDEDYEDDEEYEDEDEDEDGYDLDAYYDWVCGNDHDHAFVAERVGLDLDACRDDQVDYTITIIY